MRRFTFRIPLNPLQQEILGAALSHAQDGKPVFPCSRSNKQPLTPSGYRDATIDAKLIELWWTEYPGALIGAPMGQATGLWAVDVDPRHGGDAALLELEQRHGGPLPRTMRSTTPSGGWHFFFTWNADLRICNSAGLIGAGIDVRSEGGYVVLPPSIRSDGVAYGWHHDCAPPAAAPDWLIELARKPEPPP